MPDHKCMWCDKDAVAYCDAVIGFEAISADRNDKGRVEHLLTGVGAKMWTCDAPMCADHGKRVGFISGSDPDSIDHCPYHCEHTERDMDTQVILPSEAEQRRRDIYASIKRLRIKMASQ